MKYYDIVLLAIPGTVFLGLALSVLTVIETYQGIGGGAMIAVVLILDVMFRDPPRAGTETVFSRDGFAARDTRAGGG